MNYSQKGTLYEINMDAFMCYPYLGQQILTFTVDVIQIQTAMLGSLLDNVCQFSEH